MTTANAFDPRAADQGPSGSAAALAASAEPRHTQISVSTRDGATKERR